MAILSPLGIVSNSSIIISTIQGDATLSNGRYSINNGPRYICECYLKRQISSGTSSGELRSKVLAGADPSSWLYRGYILGYSVISDLFEHGSSESGINYESIDGSNIPTFITGLSKQQISMRFGDYVMDGYVELIGGGYGSRGIDQIIYNELSGIPIIITGTEING